MKNYIKVCSFFVLFCCESFIFSMFEPDKNLSVAKSCDKEFIVGAEQFDGFIGIFYKKECKADLFNPKNNKVLKFIDVVMLSAFYEIIHSSNRENLDFIATATRPEWNKSAYKECKERGDIVTSGFLFGKLDKVISK